MYDCHQWIWQLFHEIISMNSKKSSPIIIIHIIIIITGFAVRLSLKKAL